MTQNKKEKIVEHIKDLCNKCVEDISFDEMNIEFKIGVHNLHKSGFILSNSIQVIDEIKISNKKDDFCYYVCGDADSETIAKYAIAGYLKEKKRFLNEKKKEESEERYKKEHPILGFFK